MHRQKTLMDTSSLKVGGALSDFRGLPRGVYPIGVRILEQGGDLLIYHHIDAGKGISRKLNLIYTLLSKLGITVIACTGLSGVTYDRMVAVYDHTGQGRKLRLAQPGEIEGFILGWFNERKMWR